MMKICEDVPEIVEKIKEIRSISNSPFEEFFVNSFDNPASNRMRSLFLEIHNAVTFFPISENIFRIFKGMVDRDLENPDLRHVKFNIHRVFAGLEKEDSEWVYRRVFKAGDLLDMTVSFGTPHPKIFEFAKQCWGESNRIEFLDISFANPKIKAKRESEVFDITAHGIPPEMGAWGWALEAIETAKLTLEKLRYPFKLCDLVEWSCSNIDEIDRWNVIHGPAVLYKESKFGDYFSSERVGRKSVYADVWIGPKGTLIGPLWEYLDITAELQTNNAATYQCLGKIGQGLHAAVRAMSENHNPDSTDFEMQNHLKFTNGRIFEAGKAVMQLRTHFELNEAVHKGRKSEFVREKAGASGGKSSKGNREARVADLLSGLENFVTRNPDIDTDDPNAVAKFAVKILAKANPKLWSEGKGQIDQYLGELRRGEAGADLQARYLALFPPKPPKRSGR